MSYVGVTVSLCLPSAHVPASLTSLEDLSTITYGASTFLYAPSRNGWLNQCLSEIVRVHGLSAIPSKAKPLLTLDGASLSEAITELHELLELFSANPLTLPAFARWQATADTLAGVALPGPHSFLSAHAQFQNANCDGEGQDLPALVAFLWCQLRLMEYARDNQLSFISSEIDG
jgi:hypothetical protein